MTYLANGAFAAVLSASVGLWQPIPLALGAGLLPVLALMWAPPPRPSDVMRPSWPGREHDAGSAT
jgi:hypothetical protein